MGGGETQGFTGPPNLFGQVPEHIFEQCQPPGEALLLQYVGDGLLSSGQEKRVVKEATNKLFDFLGNQGLNVLENK